MSAESSRTVPPTETVGWGVKLAVLTALTCAWFVINGYVFGIFDHSIHLGFLLREMDPSLLSRDPIIQIAANHPSLFWKLQVPLLRLMPVEALYALLHVLSVAMMLAGTAALARALYPGPHVNWVAALSMTGVLIPRGYAGLPLLDELVLNRTVSMCLLYRWRSPVRVDSAQSVRCRQRPKSVDRLVSRGTRATASSASAQQALSPTDHLLARTPPAGPHRRI